MSKSIAKPLAKSTATQITSSSNSLFRIWKSLLTSKGIKEHRQFFLMGAKLIQEFLDQPVDGFHIEYLIYDSECPYDINCKKTQLTKELFQELDVLGTKSALLILSYHDFIEKDFSKEAQGLELICPLGDPRNLGALTRSATGLSAAEIILTKESTHPYLPQAMKASAGSALKMKFTRTALALNEIPLVGANYALALHGNKITDIQWPKSLRLWVGEEGPGLSLQHEQKKQIRFVNIPTQEVESLNAMVSTSIAIWEWKKAQK
ncbi:TrmH family RNA methyltransferase [Pseudobdellovibrio exovorus]|uniref:23S rRNA methyltransferase n=1 Tax=Pseudobdellovibrio exovorus JSS TaxID=1184267 RepID=M4VRA2_9BACT|nr:TrmH family RNA methyltransferase [Pseudobdellovibrio exovorus]AGH95709.1 23S rRNA methyltransferase [Pseudobdellovibrio exovorus JSS]